jgi:hypothetical protein
VVELVTTKKDALTEVLWRLLDNYLQAPAPGGNPADDGLGEMVSLEVFKDAFQIKFDDGSTFLVKVTRRRR